MHRYLTQFIEDLEALVVNPPEAPWTETPLHLAHDPVIAELAVVPFKTISEWRQLERVNKAILKDGKISVNTSSIRY